MQVKCLDFSVAILYIILVFAFLGWASLTRTRERRAAAGKEPLLSSMDEVEADSTEIQKDGKVDKLLDSSHPISLLFYTIGWSNKIAHLSFRVRHFLIGQEFAWVFSFRYMWSWHGQLSLLAVFSGLVRLIA